jgi:hypothetical protein
MQWAVGRHEAARGIVADNLLTAATNSRSERTDSEAVRGDGLVGASQLSRPTTPLLDDQPLAAFTWAAEGVQACTLALALARVVGSVKRTSMVQMSRTVTLAFGSPSSFQTRMR